MSDSGFLLNTKRIPVLNALSVFWKLCMSEALSSEIEAKRDQVYSLGTEAHICLGTCIAILLTYPQPHIFFLFTFSFLLGSLAT